MIKFTVTVMLFFIAFSGFAQSPFFQKEGDTLYYQNNRATYYKTDTFIIIKETNVKNDFNSFKVEKYVLDKETNNFNLDSKFITNGLQILRANGTYTSYHKNGNLASQGETINGRKGNGIWTYYYENGKKKSEEKLSEETFFNETKKNLIISFWDKNGNKTIKKGNGYAEFTVEEDNLLHKCIFKNGLKEGLCNAYSDGKLVYEEVYKKGKLIKGTSWDKEGNEYRYTDIFTEPYFKRKNNSYVNKFITQQFKSDSTIITGKILVNFLVTKTGNLSNISITKGLTANYNTEIIRILSEMKNWNPAKRRGQNVDSKYLLELNFR